MTRKWIPDTDNLVVALIVAALRVVQSTAGKDDMLERKLIRYRLT